MIDAKTMYGTYKGCVISIDRYKADNSMAVSLFNKEEGPIARITVCLDDRRLKEDEAYVDVNNCPWALQMIEEYDLGYETGRFGISGYCTYPVVRFDMDKLRSHMG